MAKFLTILLIALVFEAVGVVLLSKGLKQIGEAKRITAAEVAGLVGRGLANSNILLGVLFEAIFFCGASGPDVQERRQRDLAAHRFGICFDDFGGKIHFARGRLGDPMDRRGSDYGRGRPHHLERKRQGASCRNSGPGRISRSAGSLTAGSTRPPIFARPDVSFAETEARMEFGRAQPGAPKPAWHNPGSDQT